MILREAVAKFISHCRYGKNLSPKTLTAYSIDLRQFLTHLGDQAETLSLEALDKILLRGFIQSLFGSNADKTIKRKVATLKAFFHFLEREDYIALNPFHKMDIRIREARLLPRTVPLADIRSLFRFLYDRKKATAGRDTKAYRALVRDIAVLELLFATGARVSEVCTLIAKNVDLVEGSVRILGKGGRERIIQLCDEEILEALRAYRSLSGPPGPGEYFFGNAAGGHLSDQSVRAMLRNNALKAGLGLHLTPHMIRHSVATLLLERGMDIRYIQHLLGHSSISTTQIYTSVEAGQQRRLLSDKHPRRALLCSIPA
jgi:integrase/recombinase XerD